MKKWYEDELVRTWMTMTGMTETEVGRWVREGRTIFQDFSGGMTMTTVTLLEDPKYDIQTVHEQLRDEDPAEFFKRAMAAHTEEIKRRTEVLLQRGLDAVANKPKN